MFRRDMTGLRRAPRWLKAAATLVTLALVFLTVAADFTPVPAVSRAAHRIHVPPVMSPTLVAITPPEPALLTSLQLVPHETTSAELIDLTCCRLC